MDAVKRRDIARRRWKLLIDVLTQKRCMIDTDNSVSVRRFSSFGLLETEYIVNDTDFPEHRWYEYVCPDYNEYKPLIRHLDASFQIQDVLGFNNTGNVCVWPSEEVLTYYCLKNASLFRGKSVCELGGGMTCLSGVAVAMCTEAKDILLTDGNEKSVENADVIIARNAGSFGSTQVTARILRWDDIETFKDLKEAFDCVICADCLFFDEYREDLLNTLLHILKPQGQVVIFAPSRNGSFWKFKEISVESFQVTIQEKFDDHVWRLHEENLSKGHESYDPDIHFPMMMELTKL